MSEGAGAVAIGFETDLEIGLEKSVPFDASSLREPVPASLENA